MIPQEVRASDGRVLRLVWHDEFDEGDAPSEERWTYEEGHVRNREMQYYTARRKENVRIEDGKLVIEARREEYKSPSGAVEECTSGSLRTFGKASWQYGRIEARAKVPEGLGTWPAFWMLGDDIPQARWPRCGEIDIMEYVGHAPGRIWCTLHGRSPDPDAPGRHAQIGRVRDFDGIESRFAVYAVEWTREGFKFFVDDQLVCEIRREDVKMDPYPYDQPFFMIVNLAIGGNWGAEKGVDEAIFPAKYEIDYVRVYQ